MPPRRAASATRNKSLIVARWGDKEYGLDTTDLDRFEWRDLKAALGVATQVDVLRMLVTLELDAVAAVVWVMARREQEDLAFEEVNLRLADVLDEEEAKPAPPA